MEADRDQKMALEDDPLQFHSDVLETVLSHVPLVDLVSASRVSKSWRAAVSSSLRHSNKPRPWLILHTQARRSPYTTTSRAYDPRSDAWIRLPRPPIQRATDLMSSNSNFLYMLCLSQFSFSFDPMNFNWHHATPPRVWRRDPIVARVGNSVVIAGGGCDYSSDPLAVEILDLTTREWHSCDLMPGRLRETPATPLLSIAATAEKLIVTDKVSGETYWFDPVSKSWSGPFFFGAADQSISSYNVGWSNNCLILVGLCGIGDAESVKIWRVGEEDFACEELGEMPSECVEKLRSEGSGSCSVKIRVAGDIVYIYNKMGDVVACELNLSGGCRWWRVRDVAAREALKDRFVFTCSEIGINELQSIMRAENGFKTVDSR